MLLPPGGKNWQLAFNCYNIKIHEKKIFKLVQKQQNWTFVVKTVIWGKYNIQISKSKKIKH